MGMVKVTRLERRCYSTYDKSGKIYDNYQACFLISYLTELTQCYKLRAV